MSDVRPVHPILRALALVSSGGLFALLLVQSGGTGCSSTPAGPEPRGQSSVASAEGLRAEASASGARSAGAGPSAAAVGAGSSNTTASAATSTSASPKAVSTGLDDIDPQYFGTSKSGMIKLRTSTATAPNPPPQPANQAPTQPGGR